MKTYGPMHITTTRSNCTLALVLLGRFVLFFFCQHGRSSFNQIFWWSSFVLDTHLLPRNGTSWARLLWTDTRVAASISRKTFSHSSLHSPLSQGPWWRPSEFVRATPFFWLISKVICDICCPDIALMDVALERMFGRTPATRTPTPSNGNSTKTTWLSPAIFSFTRRSRSDVCHSLTH